MPNMMLKYARQMLKEPVEIVPGTHGLESNRIGTKVFRYRSGCMRYAKRFVLGLDYKNIFLSVGPFKRAI
jgi:hypothetical protein